MSEQTTLRDADPLAEVMQRERQLLDPRVRCQPHLVRALLHPDFLEYGASGRMWNVDATVEALAAEEGFSEMATNMVPRLLSQDVVLLTFRTDSVERACLRSSVWVHTEGKGWRMRFHQGTAIQTVAD